MHISHASTFGDLGVSTVASGMEAVQEALATVATAWIDLRHTSTPDRRAIRKPEAIAITLRTKSKFGTNSKLRLK